MHPALATARGWAAPDRGIAGFRDMKGLAAAVVLAFALGAIGAIDDSASAHARGHIPLSSARPSLKAPVPVTPGPGCGLSTPNGLVIKLPEQACASLSQVATNEPTAGGGCILTTSEGLTIHLPDVACTRSGLAIEPSPGAGSGCQLVTPEGVTITLPPAACGRAHVG